MEPTQIRYIEGIVGLMWCILFLCNILDNQLPLKTVVFQMDHSQLIFYTVCRDLTGPLNDRCRTVLTQSPLWSEGQAEKGDVCACVCFVFIVQYSDQGGCVLDNSVQFCQQPYAVYSARHDHPGEVCTADHALPHTGECYF